MQHISCVLLYFDDVIRCAGASYLIFAKTRDAIWSLPGLCEGFIMSPPSNFLLCLSTFRIFFLFCLYSLFSLSFHSVGHLIRCRFSFSSLLIIFFFFFFTYVFIIGFSLVLWLLFFHLLITAASLFLAFSVRAFPSDIFILFCF